MPKSGLPKTNLKLVHSRKDGQVKVLELIRFSNARWTWRNIMREWGPALTVTLIYLACLMFVALASGCKSLPTFPEVVQYGVVNQTENNNGFYGVNNRTGKRIFKTFSDPSMRGAQCLDAADYKESEEWVEEVKRQARKR